VSMIAVAGTHELAPGEMRIIEVGGMTMVLAHVDGQYYAVEDVCTHDGGPLGQGTLVGQELVCPRHGARFDVRTGLATRMPAFEPIESFEVKVQGDKILVEAP
jgi:3-phenylpropionate/trans-cinnamate dioxygenase ferredoxin component